jgi:hypothetical protein
MHAVTQGDQAGWMTAAAEVPDHGGSCFHACMKVRVNQYGGAYGG